jgi:hypothetical protein
MLVALASITPKAGQRSFFRISMARRPSRKKNSARTADPENSPRQNSMVKRSAEMPRTNRPADDQARAAMAMSAKPVRC